MMAGHSWLVILVFICSISLSAASAEHKRVCYFTNWSQYRLGAARYTVANVDPFLCTHLIYSFVHFDEQCILKPQMGDFEIPTYAQFNALKERNPSLKTLAAVGGWSFASSKFSAMADDPVMRNNFVTSAVAFLRQHGFDGLDLDWEYPGLRGGSAKDRDNFVLLCKELKQAFESEASGNKRLILAAAVPASRTKMDIGYNIRALDRYLDLWNLMTYDYHSSWEGRTGLNSPLHAGSRETWAQRTNNVEWTAEEYVRRGASRHKVLVGLPTYGQSYKLTSLSRHGLGAAASLGAPGPFTREPGFWAYYEVCQKIVEGAGQVKRDAEQGVPYYVTGDFWISFDDVDSIKKKTQWLKQNGYGGYMAWALDMDVFDTTLCPSVSSPYPLLSAANSILRDPSQPGTADVDAGVAPTTQAPRVEYTVRPAALGTSTNSPSATVSGFGAEVGSGTRSETGGTGLKTISGSQNESGSESAMQSGSQEFSCKGRPYRTYSHPSSPCLYIVCWADTPHYRTCPPELVFDPTTGVCSWPQGPVSC